MQQKYGSDRLMVMLLNVDPGWSPDKSYLARTKKIMEKFKIDWPNVFLADGWNDLIRMFNLSGYGLTVVDDKGVVRGIDVRGKNFEELVDRLIDDKKAHDSQH